MHTLIATAAGLIFLAVMLLAQRVFHLPRVGTAATFIVLWLVATVGHGMRGMAAGQTLLTEVLVGLVVFGVPAAVLAVRYRRP